MNQAPTRNNPAINNGLTLDFSFDKIKGDNRKELVVAGKEKKSPKILHN